MFGVPKFTLTEENSSWDKRVILSLAGAVLLSASFAIYLLGAPILDVTNTSWIWGDLSLMHLAWVQFLIGDEKGWLSTTAFSFPLSLSVALFDPLPIFLLAAQSLVSGADIERQYLGWYFVACVALQALFGFLATDRALRMAGVSRQGSGAETAGWVAVLLATMPFTFNRFQAHAALSSQWVLLLAVWVSLVSVGAVRRRWLVLHVPLILFLSGINPYLSVMGLLISLILGLAALRFWDWKEFLLRSALLSAVWVGGSWLFGFLGAAGLQTGGYGIYSMNLLGPLDSNGLAFFLQFNVPDPTSGQTWEGFNYLGFGVILLVLSAGVALVRGWLSHGGGGFRYGAFPLANGFLVILVFLLLSLSNHVSLGSHVFEIPLPDFVIAALEKFRASGRFFWVNGFMLVLISSVVLTKSLSSSKRNLVFAAFVVVQFLDIRPITLFVRESMQTAERYPPLALGPGSLSMIHVHPPWQCDPWKTPLGVRNFESIGSAAVLHQVPTNNFYAARNPTEQIAYHCNTDARLKVLDQAGVYVLNDETYSPRKMSFEKSHWCQQEQVNVNSTRQQQLLSGTPIDQMFWICRPKR